MARGLNKVMLIGLLGKDPELKYTASGVAVAEFSMATDETYKDNEGKLIPKTEWHRIVLWRKTAETAAQYLKKGKKIYLEGKLQTRNYEDKDGVKRYITEIVADTFMFLDSKERGASEDQEPIPPPAGEPDAKEDDLPF